jgi:hypothetical protein
MSIEESFKPLLKLVRPFWRTWINSRISRNCLDHFLKMVDHFVRQQVISLNRLNRFSYWNFYLVLCVSVVSWYFYVLLGLFLVLWIYKLIPLQIKIYLANHLYKILILEVENRYYIKTLVWSWKLLLHHFIYLAPLIISLNDSIILKPV